MTPETTNPEPSLAIDAPRWLAAHPHVAISFGAFCLWVSICLLLNLWLIRRGSFLKKLVWSFIVLFPLFGWVAYGGCFPAPDYHNTPCAPNHAIM